MGWDHVKLLRLLWEGEGAIHSALRSTTAKLQDKPPALVLALAPADPKLFRLRSRLERDGKALKRVPRPVAKAAPS